MLIGYMRVSKADGSQVLTTNKVLSQLIKSYPMLCVPTVTEVCCRNMVTIVVINKVRRISFKVRQKIVTANNRARRDKFHNVNYFVTQFY